MEIRFRDGLQLTAVLPTDKAALLEHLRTRDVYQTTLNIPHPYTEADADWWIQRRIAHRARVGREVSLAIREGQGKLIGVVSADNLDPGNTHKAEIGYWLAKPFWGKGIMTDAVGTFVRYAFEQLQLLRLTAHVFEFNVGSARVLERNGFKLEGRLRRHFRKDGELLDARLYGLLKEDLAHRSTTDVSAGEDHVST
ncbi:MAG: GNAT family protein [Acidobacteriota bacterium]